jgi:tripartite-type tricarboxylate transporter receptor subunit TctC
VRSVKELLALARSRPGQVQYASAGPATSQHLAGELFASMAGVKMVHVPYKGSGPALQDLLGGHVTLMVDSLTSALPSIQSGKLRAIGVTTRERVPSAPAIPAIGEQLAGYEAVGWFGVFAPARTPVPIVDALQGAIARFLERPDARERFAGLGADVVASRPAEFAAVLKADIARWARVVKESGAKVE